MSSHASQHDGATDGVTETDTLKKLIGRNIREARLAAGMTQRDLSIVVDTDVMQVSRWERGITRPGADNELRVANVLFDGDIARLYEEGAS